MELEVLGSGSKGNCYLLRNETECLMLEAGVPFEKVLRALGGDIEKLKCCLITHEHGDHAKYVKDLLNHGISVWMTHGTFKALEKKLVGCLNYPAIVSPGKVQNVGRFSVLPFKTVHDAADPCGFYINHPESGNVLFATDTHYIPVSFKRINNILIECNYDEELLQRRTDIPEELKERIRGSHMSIDTCIDALNANDLKLVHNIVLIHISEGDGDPEGFRRRVYDETIKKVHVATEGLRIPFDKSPF